MGNAPSGHSSAVKVTLCDLCLRAIAKWWCSECKQVLCERCKTIHLRGTATMHHETLLIWSMLSEKCTLCDKSLDCQWRCTTCNDRMCDQCKTTHNRSNATNDHVIAALQPIKYDKCRLCRHDNDAEWKCMSCDDKMCNQCRTRHLRSRATMDHEIVHVRFQGLDVIPNRAAQAPAKMASLGESRVARSYHVARSAHVISNTQTTEVMAEINPGSDIVCIFISAVDDKKVWCGCNDLVLMGIDGWRKKEVKIDFKLFDIAVTQSDDLLVTQSGGHSIMKYKNDGHFEMIVNTSEYRTQGICVTSQDEILVCLFNSEQENKVIRVTPTGNTKQTIQYEKSNKNLYKDPRFICENINGDVCVVDETLNNTIVVVNKNGEFRFRYPAMEKHSGMIDGCCGIACDIDGCILVSDRGHFSIHQLDKNGAFIGIMLAEQHGIHHPMGITIDRKGQLWVANKSGKKITVFKYKS